MCIASIFIANLYISIPKWCGLATLQLAYENLPGAFTIIEVKSRTFCADTFDGLTAITIGPDVTTAIEVKSFVKSNGSFV
mgnify:CR=1 FL=1